MKTDELSDIERRGLQLVQDTGGIPQSEFWKELDISSRKGSRIVDRDTSAYPRLSVSDECSDALPEPRSEQAGVERTAM